MIVTTTHALFDEMSWPYPGVRIGNIEYALRYGTPDKTDLLIAASVIHAYSSLIHKSIKDRNKIIKQLRLAINQSCNEVQQ